MTTKKTEHIQCYDDINSPMKRKIQGYLHQIQQLTIISFHVESSSGKAKNYYKTLKLDPFFVILLQHTIGWFWNIVLRRYLYNNTAGTDDGEFIVNMNVKH